MKKVLIFLLLLACICTFAACDSGDRSDGVFIYSLCENSYYVVTGINTNVTSRELSIPESFQEKPVKGISSAFRDVRHQVQVEKITLPDSIVFIEELAGPGAVRKTLQKYLG